MRAGILTGGGDCPGLNAVIRAVARRLHANGWEVMGVRAGWRGRFPGRLWEPWGRRPAVPPPPLSPRPTSGYGRNA